MSDSGLAMGETLPSSGAAAARALECRLEHAVELHLDGFRRSVAPGSFYQRAFDRLDCNRWFAEFHQRVRAAAGKQFLPIYRMADGEFIFCVGPKCSLLPEGSPVWEQSMHRVKFAFRRAAAVLFRRGFQTVWGEEYSDDLRRRVMPHFVECIRHIASQGYLAIHFTIDRGCYAKHYARFGEEYFVPVCRWFDDRDVNLSSSNYAPFVFVYALLASAAKNELFAGRSVSVVTHVTAEREVGIREGLLMLGAKRVDFAPISGSSALLESFDGDAVQGDSDIVLIGAGVGAANVLYGLRGTKAVCIDAGFFLETLIAPSRRGERLFTKTDDEWG